VIVVDASVAIEVLLRTTAGKMAEELLFGSRETLHAPHLIDIEVAQALRRYAAAGEISSDRGRTSLADFSDFRIYRYAHHALLPRVWELRANLTAYDAAYVALAEALDARLVTRDRALAAAPRHRATIELI
jgi:predicted nucleic acid-binding protein